MRQVIIIKKCGLGRLKEVITMSDDDTMRFKKLGYVRIFKNLGKQHEGMNIRLIGLHPSNKTIPKEDRKRIYEIGIIKGDVRLTEKGLTIMITDNALAQSFKKDLALRKFKGTG